MVKNLKTLLKGKDHYYLIGVYSVQDTIEYQFLEVALEVDELKIIERQHFSNADEEFKNYLKKDYPVLLHFDGDNVISRSTENKQGYRNSIVFKMNPDDFNFYEYHQDNQIYASLTRKKVIDDVMALLNKNDKFVVHTALGPFVLSQLFSLVNQSHIYTNFYALEFTSEHLVSFTKTEEKNQKVSISEDLFNQNEIALIATFLEYKQGNSNVHFDDDFLNANKEQQKYRKQFKQMSAFTIAFILLALFIGHNLLGHYVESLAQKESLYSISQQTILEVNNLREERELKEKILESSGVIDPNFLTQYFVEIGNIIPESITINSMDIAPALKKIKPNEKVTIDTKIISVIGESENDDDFNKLVKNLRAISWVKKIDITSYTEDKSGNSFVLEIKK
ncbi:PilN domain-containing protein [uncultured Psychroserpens sp.]|uniref:PilN domain-containing protein n=1 Tax=uncultured Psychroserpens sp. TaxID=255436 RepID=UPI002604B4E3|nr:PilN domain-containing protein [uncultured Psychroserpens sp.]